MQINALMTNNNYSQFPQLTKCLKEDKMIS